MTLSALGIISTEFDIARSLNFDVLVKNLKTTKLEKNTLDDPFGFTLSYFKRNFFFFTLIGLHISRARMLCPAHLLKYIK